MAKKNSSKTATEKSIQASEPRVLSFRGWKGVNFVDAPLTWDPLQSGVDTFRQTDLPDNFLMVQNNLNTTDTLGLETRQDSIRIGEAPVIGEYTYKFTGVSTVYKHWLFCVARSNGSNWHEVILYRSLKDNDVSSWTKIHLRKGTNDDPVKHSIEEIGFFESKLVATARDTVNNVGILFLASVAVNIAETHITITAANFDDTVGLTNHITDTPHIADPAYAATLRVVGMKHENAYSEDAPTRINICFCYTNRLGSTKVNADVNTGYIAQQYVELSPALWTTSKYMVISGSHNVGAGSSIRGVDIYARENENIDWVFIGHVNVAPDESNNLSWTYNWYGNMSDTSQWTTSQLQIPTENTTHGPDATHFSCHDSRMYYWGMPSKPFRLWIGGNPGSEFSIARGLGGAWVDIEPGSGYDVMGTAKWKTTSGANIVTIMCGNRNTTKVKRFNLVETNLTLTNEVAYKSYMYEEVSNVVGCNSRWGYGVFSDGLYSLSRYGLMLTTMAMEYNAQMKNQKMSDVISPIFTERLGKRLRDCRMVCIDEIIYIVLSEEVEHPDDPISLDNVIICYDMNLQAWYTWTHDETLGNPDNDHILHVLPIDSDEFTEGLGAVTRDCVYLYPVTGIQQPKVPDFQVIMETGELMPRQPEQAFWYIQQLEFRFDYFIGDVEDPATILIEGVDYYGRQFTIEKKLNHTERNWPELNTQAKDEVERRSYVEWIRIDKIVESLRIRLKGRARFRLTHINCKAYQQADTIGTPYGFDAKDTFRNRHGGTTQIHHYINDYNNLRRAVVT